MPFPLAFGDRFVQVGTDVMSGRPVVDIYRWDHELDRLVAELFHSQPLPGAPPVTVEPYQGSGAVRLGAAEDAVVGYLAGGDDPRSVVIARDRIEVRRGSDLVFELIGGAIAGFPIGLRVDDDGSISIGAPLPRGFPTRRLFRDADIVLTDLVGLPPVLENADFLRCRLVGPAIITSLGNLSILNSKLPPPEQFVWELPVPEGVVAGVIGLHNCEIDECSLDGIGLAVAHGTREQMVRRLRES